MKVKIKATGQVIEVSCGTAVAGNALYRDVDTSATYTGDELEPAEPDWQKVHIQFIGDALTGLLANPDTILKRESIVEAAIKIANALVIELKKGEQE